MVARVVYPTPAELYGLLVQALEEHGNLSLQHYVGEAATTVDITIVTKDDRLKRLCGRTLAEALLQLAGWHHTKQCLGPCRAEQPLTAFSRDRSRADGLCDRCKVCERLRVKAAKAKAKAAKAARAPTPPA